MRMDRNRKLQQRTSSINILKRDNPDFMGYGEEKLSRKIARAVIDYRAKRE